MPCVISASTLFCVETRGVEMTASLPCCSSAVSAMSRLNAPLIAPSARPTADVAPCTPEVDARWRPPTSVRPERRRSGRRPSRCSGTPAVSVLPRRADISPPSPSLRADLAAERLVGDDDARFDLDLRLRPIERRDERRRPCRAPAAGR